MASPEPVQAVFPSGRSPHWDIQGYPKISKDIQRYPFENMFWICLGYLFGISWDINWISLDIFRDTVKIFQAYPLISSLYPELSIFLSRDIHSHIQTYPSTYPGLSIYLSRAIHLPIQRYPSTYPEISIYLSKSVHLLIQRYPYTHPEISIYRSSDILPFVLLDYCRSRLCQLATACS
jgi:hypothetical protein